MELVKIRVPLGPNDKQVLIFSIKETSNFDQFLDPLILTQS